MDYKAQQLAEFLASYIETALWTSTDDKGNPLDGIEYCDADLADETRELMRADCAAFLEKTAKIPYTKPIDYVAHDFWLTRNHHGAGFWDGDYPQSIGKELTDIAHSFGDFTLYVGDDGKIYGVKG